MEALAASDHEVVSLARALELLRAGPVEGRYACVTFDDGYRDNVDNALPVLERLGLTRRSSPSPASSTARGPSTGTATRRRP